MECVIPKNCGKKAIKNKISLGFDRLRNKPCKKGLYLFCVVFLVLLREFAFRAYSLPLTAFSKGASL